MPSSKLVSQTYLLVLIDLKISLITSNYNTLKAVETADIIDLTLPNNPNL